MPTGGIRVRTSGIMVPAFVAPAAAAFQGPLDIVASATGAWGMRALSAAARGTNIIQIRQGTSHGTQDFAADAVTGKLDTAAIATFLGGEVGQIVIFYDQSGNGRNMTPLLADPDNRAGLYTPSIFGSLPSAKFDDANRQMTTAGTITISQPLTVSSVMNLQQAGGVDTFWGPDSDAIYCGWRQSSGLLFVFAGVGEIGVATGGTGSFAFQGVANGASSTAKVNGTDSGAGNAGTNTPNSPWRYGGSSLGAFGAGGTGYVSEVIVWASAVSNTNQNLIESNQRTFWGF